MSKRKRFTPKIDGVVLITIVPVTQVHKLDPAWPFSVWSTRELMRKGLLGCKRVGTKYYVTRAHLEAFIRDDDDGEFYPCRDDIFSATYEATP